VRLGQLQAIARTDQLHLDIFVPYSGRGQLQRTIIDPKGPIHLGVLERTGQTKIKMQHASTLRYGRDERFESLQVNVGSLKLYSQGLTCSQARLTRQMQQLLLVVTPAQVHTHNRALDPHLTMHLSQVVLLPAEGGQVQLTLALQLGQRAAQTEVECAFTIYHIRMRYHNLYMGQELQVAYV